MSIRRTFICNDCKTETAEVNHAPPDYWIIGGEWSGEEAHIEIYLRYDAANNDPDTLLHFCSLNCLQKYIGKKLNLADSRATTGV